MASAHSRAGALTLALLGTSALAQASWSASGPVALRPGFAAVALPNGQVLAGGGFQDSASTQSSAAVFVWNPATNSWASAPPLLEARAEHEFVSLSDGRVFAIGGLEGKREVSSTELLKPGAATWIALGARAYPRLKSSSIVLKDGRVLSFGGDTNPGPDSCPAELLDPQSGRWALVSELPPNCGVEAVALNDGRVFVAGGWDRQGARRDAGFWDPKSRTFVAAPPLRTPRARHALLALSDGNIAVFGGFTAKWATATGAELLSPRSSVWLGIPISTAMWWKPIVLDGGDVVTSAANIAWRWSPRDWKFREIEPAPLGNGQPLAIRGGGFMLLASGRPAQIFNDSTRSLGHWRSASLPRSATKDFSLVTLVDGRAWLAGGAPITESDATNLSALFDPQRMKWTAAGKLSQPRARHATALLADGRVLLAGGIDPGELDQPRHRKRGYQPPEMSGAMLQKTETWSPTQGFRSAGPLLEPRADAPAVVFNDGSVAVIGGYQMTEGPNFVHPNLWEMGLPRILASVEIWSPKLNRWSQGPSMSGPRAHHTATLLTDGRVLALGGKASGINGVSLSAPAELWDPSKKAWIRAASPRQTRSYHCAARLADGRVLLAGGYLQGPRKYLQPEMKLSTGEVWDPRTDTWSSVRPMSMARSEFAMLVLRDGRVLVVGGTGGDSTTPEIWDPATDTWTFTGPLALPSIQNQQLTLLRDGRVLLVDDKAAQVLTPG